MRHGYRVVGSTHVFKRRKRYIIPATRLEDAGGVDFWVKPAKSTRLIPVQITQRGTVLFQKFHAKSMHQREEFERTSIERLRKKRYMCRKAGVAFVLVRDFDGERPSHRLAWGDVKALMNGLVPFMCIE